ncbi:MAG: hypothetical protein JAY97_08375 [Candidatus Thiodiazotropha sp. 'RUGA']|nr:hypothetical protein [Candidatus Thiodiazotropha sp. 'RUGA']
MNPREITSLALKLFALYLLVQALVNVPAILGVYLSIEYRVNETPAHNWLWVAGLITIICAVIIAGLIWKLANKSLNQLLNSEGNSKALDLVPSNIELVIYSALGMFLFISAFSSLVFSFASTYASVNNGLSSGIRTEHFLIIGTSATEMLIGAFLALYPKKCSILFAEIRRG